MNTLPLPRRGAFAFALLLAGCGGGDSKGRPAEEEGGHGGQTSDAASGGNAGKGTGGDADASVDADTTPPTFSGATGAATEGEDRAKITWDEASDAATPAEQIAYRVYRSPTSKGQDFSRARRCGTPLEDAGVEDQANMPCYVTAPSGSTSAVVIDALPEHTYFYVVHAVDAAGNEDDNDAEVSVKTADETGPEFGGVDSVKVLTARSIEVKWGAAYDLSTSDANLTFQVFVQADGEPVPTEPAYTSKPGEHTTVIEGLEPRTGYTVWVVAFDPAGNPDIGGDYTIGVRTPEGVPPTFTGVKRASAIGREVLVLWPPAVDNETDTANIVYEIFSEQTDAACRSQGMKYTTPRMVSPPGASSVRILEPEENTPYRYAVRARDLAHNTDSNTEVVCATTEGTDTKPPLFAGVEAVTSATPTTLTVTWATAQDSATTAGQFTYEIFVSTTSPVPTTTPALKVRGVQKATLTELTPNTTYNVAVRARDRVGNADATAPIPERSAKTMARAGGDTDRPLSGGTPTVAFDATRPRDLRVSWPDGSDPAGGSTVGSLRYQVCVAPTLNDCRDHFKEHVAVVTAPGERQARINFLTPRTEYAVSVRAEDEAGNVQANAEVVIQTTATSWSENLFLMFAERCYACHSYVLNPSNMVNVGGTGYDDNACTLGAGNMDEYGCRLLYVAPKYPEYSVIFRKVNIANLKLPPFTTAAPNRYEGLQMPLDSSGGLDQEQIDTLRDWIEQGAYSN